MIRDLAVVLWKEWLELRRSDSAWIAVVTLVVFLGMIGVFLPWLLGPLWIRAPWVAFIWAWIPMFLVTTVTADAFAGERERRTLETLLATRLSDRAILWGKWLASVAWVVGATLLSLPVGVLTLNLLFENGPFLPSPAQIAATVTVTFAAGGFGGGIGVLVSLRASSVRHAQQVLAIIVFALAFCPLVLLRVLPRDWTGGLIQAVASGSLAGTSWVVAAAFGLVTLPILALATLRFRRGRIPLK
ncbi:MAG: ABC transporter permease subunit [Gemmatimonadota bacterium]|nr:ABC transporter permease subunit [Gemmatimonadota bacterium]